MEFINRIIKKIEETHLIYLVTILIFITLLTFGNSLFNSFVWDDEEQVISNPIIRNFSNIPVLFQGSTFNSGGSGGLEGFYYKPLMPLTFTINYALWGLNPFGYHLFDVLLHAVNVILIFFFFKKIFELEKYPLSKTIAFFLSLIFLIHPANTEAVVYVSSTQEVLYTFFLILSLILTINLFQKSKASIKLIFFINITVLFSLLSKEAGIIAIPIILILTFIFARRKLVYLLVSLFLTFLFYLILRFPIAKTPLFQHDSIIPIANTSLAVRLITIPYELFSYIRLVFFPKDLFIAQHNFVSSIFDSQFYLSSIIVVLITTSLVLFLFKIKSKLYVFFLLYLVFSFSILLNIYPLDMTIAERWLYGPMIGILGILGVLIHHTVKKNKKIESYLFLVLFLIIPIFTIRTIARTYDWKNSLSLFSKDIKYSKNAFDLQNNYGVALFREGNQKEAKKHFEESIKLSPKWWTPYNNLGVIYEREGNYEKAKYLYQMAIKNGNYYLAFENLALLKIKTEKPKDVIFFLEKALTILPYNETLNRVAAFAYYQNGSTDSAKVFAQRAYLLNKSQENYTLLQTILNKK